LPSFFVILTIGRTFGSSDFLFSTEDPSYRQDDKKEEERTRFLKLN
jgi:hypothetical protein